MTTAHMREINDRISNEQQADARSRASRLPSLSDSEIFRQWESTSFTYARLRYPGEEPYRQAVEAEAQRRGLRWGVPPEPTPAPEPPAPCAVCGESVAVEVFSYGEPRRGWPAGGYCTACAARRLAMDPEAAHEPTPAPEPPASLDTAAWAATWAEGEADARVDPPAEWPERVRVDAQIGTPCSLEELEAAWAAVRDRAIESDDDAEPPAVEEPEWPIATTLGAIRRAHPTWLDAGQLADTDGWTDDLDVAIGADGSVYLPDEGDEISPPSLEFRAWAEGERARLVAEAEEDEDPVSPKAVAEYRAALAEAAYAGSCPWGYGACYHGRLCNEEAGEGWYEGSAGCAYTTPPR